MICLLVDSLLCFMQKTACFDRWITKLEWLGKRRHQLSSLTVMIAANLQQGERCVLSCRRISYVCGGMLGEFCQRAWNWWNTHFMNVMLTVILYHCDRVMLFIFALPVMQVILFCLAIGRDPIGLHLAVVNHELNQSGGNCEFNDGCSFKMLSCRYLQNLNNISIVKVSVSPYMIP